MRSAKLSDTSLKYLAALYDSRTASEAPSVPKSTQLSLKQKVFIRGALSTGTTGYGFITVAPARLLGSDIACVNTTTSSSVMSSTTAINAVTNLSTAARSNSAYLSAAYGNGPNYVQWKLVSCTLHLKYAGTRLNKGGDMILVEEPDHGDLFTSGISYSSAMSYDMAKRVEVSDEWQHVCYTPSFEGETDFNTGSLTSATNSSNCLGVMINSAGSSQPFDYEIYCWYECVGTNVRGATQSYQDPIGWAAIDGAVNQFQQLDSVVGPDGLIKAVETQFNNFSGVHRSAGPTENFIGLASFLPSLAQLADRAMPVLRGAMKGALNGMGLSYTNSGQSTKTKTGNSVAKAAPLAAAKQAPAKKKKN